MNTKYKNQKLISKGYNLISFPLSFTHSSLAVRAEELIATYGFHINHHVLPRLNLSLDQLEWLVAGFKPLFVNFNDAKWLRRSRAGKQQGLIKACQPSAGMRIIDTTAGWGRDATILAHSGANVLMLERHPVMAALLEDGLKRLQPLSKQGQLSLHYGNAVDYLKTLTEPFPEVIYIDPMHPTRQKSALVKKDMQALQDLIGPDMDAYTLLECARQHVSNRVVVKWPQHEPFLIPTLNSIPGKTIRFDIYDKLN